MSDCLNEPNLLIAMFTLHISITLRRLKWFNPSTFLLYIIKARYNTILQSIIEGKINFSSIIPECSPHPWDKLSHTNNDRNQLQQSTNLLILKIESLDQVART